MSDVSDFISEIETMYRREYKDEENSFIRDRLFSKGYDQKVLIRALEEIERIDSDFLPAPKKVVALADKANHDMAPKENQEREAPKSNTDNLDYKMAKKLRELIFSGKISRQIILDNIRAADKASPNSGWDKCGMTLERHYNDSKFDLSKAPNNFIMEA